MNISQQAIDLIKQFEGFRSQPYFDSVGVCTIGYGTTNYDGKKKVKMTDPPITEQQAEQLLMSHLNRNVLPVMQYSIKQKLTQNQVDAIASFIYNVGSYNFTSSTLLKKITVAPADRDIKTEWMKWIKAGEKELPGLVRRRTAEYELYSKG